MPSQSEEIEKEFDDFFRSIGYARVTDIVGHSPAFKNADYINYDVGICAELKVIDKDYFENGGVIDSMQMIVAIPERVEDDGQGFYRIEFPELGRNGRPDNIEEPIRRLLKKANRQLRETNDELMEGKGHGLALIAFSMSTVIDPFIIRNLAHMLLSREFRSVSGVMICTPKMAVTIEGRAARLFLHTHDDSAPPTVLEEINRIGESWCEFSNNGGHGDDDALDEINTVTPSLAQFSP